MTIHWKKLTLSGLAVFTAAACGSVATAPAIGTWYATLQKPEFNPPNWIFGPVWTVLYILMAVSLYRFWSGSSKTASTRKGYILFFLQLGANTFWSILFFGLQMPLVALFEIGVLWSLIMATILVFWKINKLSAVLLIPYLLWVSFATVLNLFIVLLN